MPLLCAKAVADPAPLEGGFARGGCAGSDAVAVADQVGRGTGTCNWVRQGRRCVVVRASELAGVSIYTFRNAVFRGSEVRRRTD